MASIFSKIIKGEIPCYKIAENEEFFSFLDINPIAEGHTLVIPKKETDYIFDLSDESLQGLISFSKRIAKAIDIKSHAKNKSLISLCEKRIIIRRKESLKNYLYSYSFLIQ